MDAFYSSVEQRDNPSLRGKPVIVGADPKGGRGRGVVAGCSYEARRFGVHSAQPISLAYRLCPIAIYIQPNFTLYEQASEQVMKLLKQFTERLEPMSIDEAFMDVTEKVTGFDEAAALAAKIKGEVKEKVQLTCSIGAAPNKSVAKIASDFKKPDGLTIVPSEKVREFLAPLHVGEVSGIGKKSSEVLNRMGVTTIGDLEAIHPSQLTDVFGKYGTRLWQVANGIEEDEVITSYSAKSISSETTFAEDVADRGKVMEAFDSLITDVHSRVLSEGFLFHTVGIKVRLEDFTTFTRAKTYPRYSNDKIVMEECVRKLFSEFEQSSKKIRLVGVRVAKLRKTDPDQETILSWSASKLEDNCV
jgi:DNA polymerase IV (DinB-like DNA polymerase)